MDPHPSSGTAVHADPLATLDPANVGVVARAARGERSASLDNLKTLLIAGIIASHAVMGYATFGSWTYQDVREVSLSGNAEKIQALAFLLLGGLFLMALFFLIGGLLTEGSLARKGPSRYVTDRLLRLGVPLAVYTVVVWPLLEYALFGPFKHVGFWRSVTNGDPILDNGPMWFVGVLLAFSLALVGWRRLFPPPPPTVGQLRWRTLVMLVSAVAAATFLVRIVLPIDSNQPMNLKLWGWPGYVTMFGLGVAAARRDWLRPVPRMLARRSGTATLASTIALVALVVTSDLRGLDLDVFFGGWTLWAFVWATLEGTLTVAGPIWVLSVAQRRLNGTGPVRAAAARSSYLAFMMQGPVLIGLALALRTVNTSGDLKALVVAVLGVITSFGLAWPIITRTRVGRFL
jgi:hypothetical protein